MKFAGFIMAFLIFALNCIPCADDNAMSSPDHQTEVAASNHSSDNHGEDSCSPFCQCQCCAVYSINHTTVGNSDHVAPSERNYNSFYSSHLINVSLPVWQPPQL